MTTTISTTTANRSAPHSTTLTSSPRHVRARPCPPHRDLALVCHRELKDPDRALLFANMADDFEGHYIVAGRPEPIRKYKLVAMKEIGAIVTEQPLYGRYS